MFSRSAALLCSILAGAAAEARAQGNLLLLVADDLGVDGVGAYAEGDDPPPTPNIDALAAGGRLFRNAYADPVCSPTRAQLQTGRHGFRTGVGWLVDAAPFELPLAEVTLAEALQNASPFAYSSAAIGKWHLSHGLPGTKLHPLAQGYQHHSGSQGNLGPSGTYFQWLKLVDGVLQPSSQYATSAAVDDALAWIGTRSGPWFCQVSFNAPHAPLHAPPAHLHSVPLPVPFETTSDAGKRAAYRAMVMALDTEIGRLLQGLGPETLAATTVIFVGDNGTPSNVTVPPFDPAQAKLTVFEGGTNVPLIVSGPAVALPGLECAALVQVTDVFATLVELAGGQVANAVPPGTALDSLSLLPFLAEPTTASQREVAYAELFFPNGPGVPSFWSWSTRDSRYKLIRDGQLGLDRFYDLWTDPFEQDDLLQPGPLTPAQQFAYNRLVTAGLNLQQS